MTTLTYSLTRQQAADYLGVSTRTIDRYVVKGDLRYKKIANKVVLSQEDVERLHHDLELIQQAAISGMPTTAVEQDHGEESSVLAKSTTPSWTSRQHIKEFVWLLQEKDKTIEEKNQVIFGLQHHIGQLESRLQQVIALPDYTAEKTDLENQIQSLESHKTTLEDQVKREKLRNAVYMWLIMIWGVVIALLIL